MPPNIGVTDQTPTISKFITVAAVTVTQNLTVTVPVPLSVLVNTYLFMPPGVNWQIGVAFGFNGKKFIPTDDVDGFLYGSGVMHVHPAGWQVQNGIDVFLRCNNLLSHRIYVAFDLDRRPTQANTQSSLVLPR